MDRHFPKEEKLKSKKLIDELFSSGKSVKAFPLVMIYKQSDLYEGVVLKAGFSVSRKKFKRAVDRNKVKRRMREAYRLNKAEILSGLNHQYSVMFICIASEIPPYREVEKAVIKLLSSLIQEDQ